MDHRIIGIIPINMTGIADGEPIYSAIRGRADGFHVERVVAFEE